MPAQRRYGRFVRVNIRPHPARFVDLSFCLAPFNPVCRALFGCEPITEVFADSWPRSSGSREKYFLSIAVVSGDMGARGVSIMFSPVIKFHSFRPALIPNFRLI
jgi:hypothetical protein